MNASVEEHWNVIENAILQVIDSISPNAHLVDDKNVKNSKIPPHISQKLNKRKSLLRNEKITGSITNRVSMRLRNKEIATFFRM